MWPTCQEGILSELLSLISIFQVQSVILRLRQSLHKPRKHFGQSFLVDVPTVWHDVSDDVHSATSVTCRKKLKSYLSLLRPSDESFFNLISVSMV